MSRTFAYCRVTTADQTTDNQVQEIAAAGFAVTKARTIVETVSVNVAAKERKGFARLFDKLEASDVLIVTKLDQLGRNAMDVRDGRTLRSGRRARALPGAGWRRPDQSGWEDDNASDQCRCRI